MSKMKESDEGSVEVNDELMDYIPGYGICSRLRRACLGARLISDKHHLAQAIFKSTCAISEERREHLQHNYMMIHPFSVFRIRWELLMILVLMLSLLLIPFHVAYNIDVQDEWFQYWVYTMFLIDCVCLTDIFINFVTGYFKPDTKDVLMDFWIISRIYVKGMFVVDLVSSLPFDFIIHLLHSDYRDDVTFFYAQILTLIKAFRLKSLLVYLNNLLMRFAMSLVFQTLLKSLLTFALYVHWNSCMQYFIPLAININDEPDQRTMTWVSELGLWDKPKRKKYTVCLFRSLSLLFCAGDGGSIPKTDEDLLFSIVSLICGAFIKIFIIAYVLQLTRIVNASTVKYQEMVIQLREYMRHKQMPTDLQQRLLNYYEFRFQKSYFREQEIVNTISGQLKQEVELHSCRRLVENVTFFNNLPTGLLVRIVTCLHSEIYLVNDVIVKAGTVGNCMFFIATGTVAVYSPMGLEVCHLEDGAHFGEIALVVEGDRRFSSVVAVEPCEVYRLDRKDFLRVVSPYPDLLSKVEEIAEERMEETFQIDEELRRYQNMLTQTDNPI